MSLVGFSFYAKNQKASGIIRSKAGRKMSTGGEVANALVCKTSIHGFKSHSVLHNFNNLGRFRDFGQPIITHDKLKCSPERPSVYGLEMGS